MHQLKLLTTTVAMVTLTGCAGLRGSSATPWPWAEGEGKAPPVPVCKDMSQCTKSDAMAAYMSATEFCRKLHAYYESGGRKNEGYQFGMGAAGVLAGSVFAPISKGTAAKAWSGLSGAANAVQLSMEETFAMSVAVRRSMSVKKAADAGADKFAQAGKDADAQVLAAVEMARKCSMAAAQADAESLEAIRTVKTD